MLPREYKLRRRLDNVRYGWVTVVSSLAAIFLVSLYASWRQHRLTTAHQSRLLAAAEPVQELRSTAVSLEQVNETRRRLCRLAESSRPDDSLLQTLAAVSSAVREAGPVIDVLSIHVELPREGARASEPGDGAAAPGGAVAVRCRCDRFETAERFSKTLAATGRVESTSVRVDPDKSDSSVTMVIATPLVPTVLP
jgi:hypothetical protein